MVQVEYCIRLELPMEQYEFMKEVRGTGGKVSEE